MTNPAFPRSDPVTVLIVDDHPAVRMGLAAMLSADDRFEVVGEAGDADRAVEAAGQHAPDVVLMDLRSPGGGVEATIEILTKRPETRVLMITTFDGDEDIHRAILAGASGYLLKGLTSAELRAAVIRVAQGEEVMPPQLARRLAARVRRKDLSPREMEIVRLIVAGRSNKEIAADLGIGEESVKSHLKSLFQKLEVADRTQAAIEAIRHGIVHIED
jgi:DNA-binding NarL/FixJ family response regulator